MHRIHIWRLVSVAASVCVGLMLAGCSGESGSQIRRSSCSSNTVQNRAYVSYSRIWPASNGILTYDTATDSLINDVPFPGAFNIVAVPDGSRIYFTSYVGPLYAHVGPEGITAIDTTANSVLVNMGLQVEGAYINASNLVASSDCSRVYVTANGPENAYLLTIDTATNSVIATVLLGNSTAADLTLATDGGRVYITSDFYTSSPAHLWTVDTAKNVVVADAVLDAAPLSGGLAVTPDGRHLYIANPSTGVVSVMDTATYAITATIPAGGYPGALTITPDGTSAWVIHGCSEVGRFCNSVSQIDTATNTVIATVPLQQPSALAISSDGNHLWVVGYESGTLSVIDTATKMVTTFSVNNPVAVALGP